MKLTKEEKLSLKKRTEKKIEEIESYINDLLSFKPETLEEYEANSMRRAACERCCEKIAEAVVDLAIFMIRYLEIDFTDEDNKAFGILFKNRIINEELYARLDDLKGMRDRIAHQYDKVDNSVVYHAISEEIERDTTEFLNSVNSFLEKEENKK